MDCRMRQFLSWLLLIGTLFLGILWDLGLLSDAPAIAAISQLEEAPGQVVYQSRQSLKDQHGQTWQAIAFKRIQPNGSSSIALRLVGFPSVTEIDHSRPLKLSNFLGKTLQAADISEQISSDNSPISNVAQYDVKSVLTHLEPVLPITLTLPTVNPEKVHLFVSPTVIQEWQTVASD